jgi:hypothetical protein
MLVSLLAAATISAPQAAPCPEHAELKGVALVSEGAATEEYLVVCKQAGQSWKEPVVPPAWRIRDFVDVWLMFYLNQADAAYSLEVDECGDDAQAKGGPSKTFDSYVNRQKEDSFSSLNGHGLHDMY